MSTDRIDAFFALFGMVIVLILTAAVAEYDGWRYALRVVGLSLVISSLITIALIALINANGSRRGKP